MTIASPTRSPSLAPRHASAPPSDRTASLLAALAAFRIDDVSDAGWSFAQRLARENRWSLAFAERVIVEYKRFLALSVLADHVICPSEQIDQAWHLHLTYTRSYWDRLCGGILGRPLHHSPTTGGPIEHHKHHELYQRTLDSYHRLFGAPPPSDLWPPPSRRFGADLQVARVNTAETWLLDKALARRLLAVATAVAACAVLGWLTA